MNGTVEKYFQAAAAEIPAMLAWVEEQGTGVLARTKLLRLLLAAEEICTNIVLYAYAPEIKEQYLLLSCEVKDQQLLLKITDGGRPFDPLAVPGKSAETDLAAAAPGGFGRTFMRSFVDGISYSRERGQNILRLTVKCVAAEKLCEK
ncbi:ATP-binding protein [uncultured Phascolarctobacterium sp.]|uniref:ATP-binding protein n=1 Tax=uncultured Phascolarctobacterium sp. TaxID=512296 RepID=UPI002625C3E5|nr:ATP-binding protein [uncultured Phascolarctobacterium sp.]